MKRVDLSREHKYIVGMPGLRVFIMPIFILLLFVLLTWNLASPSPWWDEGWTLTVARNLAEHGHYGRMLNGQLTADGMNAAYTVTVPVALSFKLFGVGIWQGRLFGVFCTIGALLLMYWLARQIYNRGIAASTLFVLLLMPMHPLLHPIINGRQVMAEMPMLFYLLAGYALFLVTLHHSRWFLLPVIICWSIALVTKAQILPFWTVALSIPLAVALLKRQWRMAGLWSITLFGALITAQLLPLVHAILLLDHNLSRPPLQGIYSVTALVFNPANRLSALVIGSTLGLPTLLGLGYGAWEAWVWLRRDETSAASAELAGVRLSLLVLAGSWFAWYVLLSVSWMRYLFPAVFLGSFFLAALLYHLMAHLRTILHAYGYSDTRQQIRPGQWQRAGGVLAIFLVIVTSALTIPNVFNTYRHTDYAAQEVAQFLHTHTAADALIETYDSEILFLLDRPYHYPPDQLVIELNRRTFLNEEVPIDYNPLAADPDYLVVGSFSRMWQLYDTVISEGAFRPLRSFGGYEVYERVR
jgi:4-amino-4-deoxy-L-arabinose transferase-like glycosyltransferase